MMYRTQDMGDPGFLSSLGRIARGAIGVASRVLPGGAVVRAVAGIAGRAVQAARGGRGGRAGPQLSLQGAGPGARVVSAQGVARAQAAMFGGKKGRRINPGNATAARRAIRRIKSVRRLLMSIERQLPRRPAKRSQSVGVITRGEASRALRS